MAVPTTTAGNISFFGNNVSPPYDGIWSIANPASPSASNESLGELLAYDWFHGPNGGGTVQFNGWGEYTGTSGTAGDSRIYGIPINSSNINYKMSDPAGLEYYYDDPTSPSKIYYSQLTVTNNLPATGPPRNEFVTVDLYCGNPFGNFSYINGNVPNQPNGIGTSAMNNVGSPLINNAFWYLTVSTDPNFAPPAPLFTATVALSINGTTVFTAGAALGAGTNNYTNDWTGYTVQSMGTWGGTPFTGFEFVVDIS